MLGNWCTRGALWVCLIRGGKSLFDDKKENSAKEMAEVNQKGGKIRIKLKRKRKFPSFKKGFTVGPNRYTEYQETGTSQLVGICVAIAYPTAASIIRQRD